MAECWRCHGNGEFHETNASGEITRYGVPCWTCNGKGEL